MGRPLSDQEIGQRLRAVTAAPAPGSLGPTASDELRLSVAGAQLEITSRRMLITRTPAAVASVQAQLPDDFPESVAEPVLAGLKTSASQLQRPLP